MFIVGLVVTLGANTAPTRVWPDKAAKPRLWIPEPLFDRFLAGPSRVGWFGIVTVAFPFRRARNDRMVACQTIIKVENGESRRDPK